MKLFLAQINPELNNKAANLRKVLEWTDRGLAAGANLIAFGECALNGYDTTGKVDYAAMAEIIPGPATEQIAARVKGKPCLVIVGMAERSGPDIYNSAVIIGRDGVIGTARKLYLVYLQAKTSGKLHDEARFFKAGEQISYFDTEFGRIGVLICLDNRHPEIAYAQAIAGCWLKVRPSAGPLRKNQPDISPLDLGRGIETQMADAYVNIVGDQGGTWYRGGSSVIVGAEGVKRMASFGKKAREEALEYDVSPEDVDKARGQWRNIRDVRPDLMKQLWETATKYQQVNTSK